MVAPDQSASIHQVAPAPAIGWTMRPAATGSGGVVPWATISNGVSTPALARDEPTPVGHRPDQVRIAGLQHQPIPARRSGEGPLAGRDRHDPDGDPRRWMGRGRKVIGGKR